MEVSGHPTVFSNDSAVFALAWVGGATLVISIPGIF